MTTVTYPFDPTGSNPLNRIVNEQHVLTSLNNTQLYQTVMPSAAPFFSDNLILSFRNPDNSVRILTEGVDYYFTHQFISASKATAKPVYGSITFLDRDIQGVLRLTYQTLGGVWTLTDSEIADILANMVKNPRTTAWEQITDLPFQFPVIDHEWNLVDMVGASDIVDAIDSVRDAILAGNAGGIAAHINDKTNPHEVTKTQVGLGSVQNYPVSSQAQAEGGTNNTTYMTPLRVAQAIAMLGGGSIVNHLEDFNNPHNVTKAQVGLANVENYPMATVAQAEAGISTAHYMSPALTKAVVDIVSAALTAHMADDNNPHNTDKNQIELYNVENYAIATAQEAQAGDVNNKYMTPLRTKQAIAALASGEVTAHTMDFDNPHNVTKAQVGLALVENYAVASQAESEAGTANNRFMTPLRVTQAISAQIGQAFLDHLNDTNPHNVTAAQVGAYTQAEVDNLIAGRLAVDGTANRALLADNATLLDGQSVAGIVSTAVTEALSQVGVSFAPQTKIEGMPFEAGRPVGDEEWSLVRLGLIAFDDQPGADTSKLQWVISGGGPSNYPIGGPEDVRNSLVSFLLTASLAPNTQSGGAMRFEYSLQRLSMGGFDNPLTMSIYREINADEVVFYARVPNGYNQITVTELNPNDLAPVEPLDMGSFVANLPAGSMPLVESWLHQADQEFIGRSEITNDVIPAVITSVNGTISTAVSEIMTDMESLRDAVTASFEAITTALAALNP